MDAYPEAFKNLEGPVQLGTTTITFRARSTNSKLNEICRMTVTAVQQQPPEVVYCPESFTIQMDEGETARLVYWKEPTFRAIGHLKQLYKSKQPGDKFGIGEHYVSYVATDADGQSSKCNFKVTIKGRNDKTGFHNNWTIKRNLISIAIAIPQQKHQLECRLWVLLWLQCQRRRRLQRVEWQITRAICCVPADNQCRFLRITT